MRDDVDAAAVERAFPDAKVRQAHVAGEDRQAVAVEPVAQDAALLQGRPEPRLGGRVVLRSDDARDAAALLLKLTVI